MSHHESTPADSGSQQPPSPESDDTDWTNTGSPAGGDGAQAAGGWSAGGSRWTGTSASATAQAWLAQLETIIDNLATQSAPAIREVGAKAAEVAALAAERAGPLAIRAADATAQATVRVAERSRTFAADLRRAAGEAADAGSRPGPETGPASGDDPAS